MKEAFDLVKDAPTDDRITIDRRLSTKSTNALSASWHLEFRETPLGAKIFWKERSGRQTESR
jgi:hypothetical protein